MKTNLLLNQSFGTVGGSNQTGETLTRENRIGLMSYLRRTLMLLFAVLVMSMANIGMAWGDTYADVYTNPASGSGLAGNANGKGAFSVITPSGGVSFGNSSLQIGTNGGSGTFTIASIDGSYITSIAFTSQSSYPINTLTSEQGTITIDGSVYTFTPNSATLTSATFSMSAQSGKKVRVAPITVNLTSDHSYLSMNFGVSSGTVSCTKSSGAADLAVTTTGSASSNRLSFGSGKTLTFTSEEHNITAIHFTFVNHADVNNVTASTGTFSGSSWTPDSDVKTVTFTSTGSNTIGAISVKLTAAAPEPACGETAQAALTLSSNSGTICGTGSTTFTVSGGSGSGALSVATSDPSKATASIDGTTVTVTGVAAGSATITVTKACDATYAEKTATYSATVAAIPTANAGIDKTTEPDNGVALAATAAADGCTGAWTIVSGPNTSTAQLSSTSSATATFTPTVAGTYTLRWTVTNTSSSCSAYDEMTVSAAVCSISSCGNATITYPLNVGTSLVNTAANLVSTPSNGGSAALTVPAASAAVTLSTITISATDGKKDNYGKAAAATNACYPTAPTMSSKIGMYNGSSYSSSNYLQFAFTVNSGYTFTPCDIQFTVQPVSNIGNFRWEVTDGTNIYGYGVATDIPVGSSGGASVMTGLTSTTEMAAGDYYIRLYPYYNGSNTFRISNNVILKGTTASAAPSCTAPSSVTVAATNANGWRYTIGETIDLTATATGGSGGSYTYQWQKYIDSDWADIDGATNARFQKASCTSSDGGSYRCVVSTGTGCELASSGYQVYVFTLNGNYYGGVWTEKAITWTGANTGTVTLDLTESSTYMYKVTNNDGKWYGGTSGNFLVLPAARDHYTDQSADIRLFTGPAGNYTFTIDITHFNDYPGTPYVNISVAYPSVSHPAAGYAYFKKWDWSGYYVHWWYNDGSDHALSEWGYDPQITTETTICGTDYIYFPVLDTYNQLIVKDAAGTGSNSTIDLSSTGSSGKYFDFTNNNAWNTFTTYTITYAANGGGGSMTATSGICPDANQAITSNAFTAPSGCASFSHWTANVNVKVGGNTITAGDPIANGATIQNINSNITLTAVWKLATPTITDNGDNTFSISGSMAGSSYYYTTNSSTPTTSSSLYSSAVDFSAGEADITAKAIAHKDGYVDSDVASQACTYHAPATLYTVTFNSNGGSAVSPVTQASEGAAISMPAAPTKADNTFQGWQIGGNTYAAGASYTPTANVTAYATWKADCAGGGGGSTTLIDWTPSGITKATKSGTATPSGGTVSYAVEDPESSGNITTGTDGKTYYKFGSSGNFTLTLTPPAAFQAGDVVHIKVTATSATTVGFKLKDKDSPTQTITGSVTTANTPIELSTTITTSDLNAGALKVMRYSSSDKFGQVWVTRAGGGGGGTCYYVTYDGNGAESGSISDATAYASGANVTVLGNTGGNAFTKAGYEFTGWNTLANGTGTPYSAGGTISGISGNVTLFAQWRVPCTTPASPSGLTNGATTANTQVVTWTANGEDTWEVYYSTSSSTPGTDQTPTATVTSATYTFTGLTASTTYYWWARSKCDDTHKSAWTAGTSFTTSAAAATPILSWALTTNSASWTATPTNNDETNLTNVATSTEHADIQSGATSGKTCKISLSSSATPDKYVTFTFKVACGKKLTPSSVWMEVANVGGGSGGKMTHKAEFSDNFGHTISATVVPASDGVLNELNITNGGGTYFQGDVTLKVWAWNSSGTSGTAFRMGPDVKIFGEVANQATPAATITWNTQPANGQVGDPDFAYAVSCSDGSSVTVTSANTTYATIVGGKLHYAAAGTTHLVASATDACGNTVTPVNSNDFTVTVPVTYSITYHCNGAESGCPSDVAATTNLPSPLPTGLTKDGYDFGGWFTDSECTVAAVAGAALTGNTDLYAKWTVHSASECITIAYFETTAHNNSSSKPDNAGKYIYGYTNSAKTEAYAYTITSSTGDNKGQGTGESDYLRMNYGTTVTIYADNTTTGGTPASFSNVTSVSVDFKMRNSTYYTSFDIYVGSTKIANNVSLEGAAQSAFTTFTYDNLEQLSGTVRIVNKGSGSSNYHFYVDNIVICTASMSSCTTPTLPTATLSNQTVCEGSDIAAWDATPTNASTISGKSESISYSWKKKGNDTELATTATFDLGASAAESQAGTYVVTVTVSKAGYTSATVSEEIELGVTESTEVTSITADKATVYEGNSVTLTATANTTVTWQWYTCTNAEGAGEASIGGATSASYTIASAGAVGTYYYKVKATSSCGTASAVYTLTVSPAASSEDCFHFVSVIPESNINISSGASIVTPTHATTLEGGTMKVGSQQVVITAGYGLKMEGTKTVSITLESALEAGNVVIVKGTSGTKGYGITINGVNFYDADNKTFDVSYTVLADDGLEGQTALTVSKYSGSSYLQEIQITGCGEACSDPEVTASVDNSTICVGGSVTFTATNAHASATYQWQKYSGSAWTNISGAESATYTIDPAAAEDETKYRVIASHVCSRTSNEVTLNVAAAPVFGDVPSSVSIMQTLALSISTVEATDAVKYRWYKSADATWDAGDVEIGTNKELIKAYDSEAIGSPSYYIFCRAQNACGITTSTAIAVNVTTYVEEDCATRGNEGDAAFGFEYSASQATYNSTACWSMNDNSKKLIYAAPEGKYFKTMKVTIASSSASKASYNWSTNGGTTFTEVAISSINTTLTEKTIDVSAHGNVNALQIGRNLDGKGESSGTLYVSKICFEYTDACTATTVTPSTASTSYEMGGAWSNPTFTLNPVAVSGETLTYSSSNEDIASVDDDGTVTFNGEAGTVTITASYAGGRISATDYCASSGSYTITVSCTGGAPKVVADGSTEMEVCNSSVTLHAKKQDGTAFADGTYQWFRNGTEIDGATSSSYTATQAGTYTVERTNASDCTTPSTNSAIVTSETTEPEVERLVPFQYYHVDKTYSDQMKMRHLFAVKNSGKLDGKSFKMYVSRNGGAATDVTSSNALVVWPNGDGHVDTVMVDLNKLSGKYSEDDELVFTCKAIDCEGNISEVYKNTITMNVIGETPTLALICSGSSKAGGTRKTGELTVGGDFLTGYNVADLCLQTGNTSFDANTEWGLYTDLKANYIVTPVNGYAVFNKLNYEPFDILLLTDYPKASKSDAAKDVLDDMAALCDYRPMLSFKTHMVAKSPSKWAEKGFTTSATENKADGRLNLNIVCYAHPMFEGLKSGEDVYTDVGNTSAPLVYTMLSGTGYESNKGMQGFEIAAAENFITIGLTHYNGTITKDSPETGEAEWTPGSGDRMLVTVAERQANPEARFILFSLNCGAQSKLTAKGEEVILACLAYLVSDASDPLTPAADCSFTFDNGASNEHDAAWYASNCPLCTGTKGDGKWTTAANWGPDYRLLPGEFTSVRIKKPVEVDDTHAHVMDVRIIEEGSIDIPAGKALDVKSTIRRMDGSEIYPTEENDIHIGSASTGNGTLIFNNNDGDTKARVDMYSNAQADMEHMSAATSTWQYIGTPHSDVASATHNYYDSWLYQYSGSGWEVIPNGGPLVPFRGYCVTHPDAPVVFSMEGTLVATTAQDIAIPTGYTVIANSWTAPIDINAITDDDMENISDKTIYFFNTGSDADGTAETGTEAGTYRATPIHSASYTGDWQIPSMQGFYISTTSAGTFHLDYERHVRPTGSRSVVSNQMYAPRRAAAESDEPNVLKIFARGSRYQDKLVVLEREDFTRGYDSGWDGEAWGGGTLSPMVYVTGDGREDAVSAIPEFEGTVVAFKAGEDSEYRFEFIYDGDESLYLFDTENNTYTQVMTGNAYYFTTTDKAAHSRFILTRKNPQITTGVEEPTSDSSLKGRARKLLIEDKMYILLNGMLYDATGKVVK